jgi:uncharacterized HAD superfamily protein
MKIGLDIDGIILDFERTMRTYAELYDLLILRKKGVKDSSQFDYLKRYDWTDDEKKNFINNYLVYATINSTPLIPLVKEMIDLFQLEGYEFLFITARGLLKKETKEAVIQVFKRNNIPTDNIYWGVEDKVSKCKELGIDIMIEDNPSTCKLLIENKIRTLYFRDKDNEIIRNNEFLTEVSNVGEICRQIFASNSLKNSTDTYEKILLRNRTK